MKKLVNIPFKHGLSLCSSPCPSVIVAVEGDWMGKEGEGERDHPCFKNIFALHT